jgi:hypothetical protein
MVMDGEMVVIVGDMARKAFRKMKACWAPGSKHVSMCDGWRRHQTYVTVHDKAQEILVDLMTRNQGKEGEWGQAYINGNHTCRIRWKLHVSTKVDRGGDNRVIVSWDLHNWLFPSRKTSSPPPPPPQRHGHGVAHAMFIFCFEVDSDEHDLAEAKENELLDKARWQQRLGRLHR